jgi:hypothetical protein
MNPLSLCPEFLKTPLRSKLEISKNLLFGIRKHGAGPFASGSFTICFCDVHASRHNTPAVRRFFEVSSCMRRDGRAHRPGRASGFLAKPSTV